MEKYKDQQRYCTKKVGNGKGKIIYNIPHVFILENIMQNIYLHKFT